MISKSQIKLVRSLDRKKNREQSGMFVAEGRKVINDLLADYECVEVFATEQSLLSSPINHAVTIITSTQLEQMSFMRQSQGALALFKIKNYDLKDLEVSANKLILALDDIQDPGNLGTIIRTADWFGIHQIVCSEHTADIYNPKVVQASMGALARVKVYYTDISAWLRNIKKVPIYGTLLDGKNIYDSVLTDGGIVVMGNEGNGISTEVRSLVTNRLLIPNYPTGAATSESLNVSIATALVCSEFRRRTAQNPIVGD